MVITGLTRNQLGSNPPRVRISPSPPKIRNRTSGAVPFFVLCGEIRKDRFGFAELQPFSERLQRSCACRQKVYLLPSEPPSPPKIRNRTSGAFPFLFCYIN